MIELWGWVSSEIAPQIEAVTAVMATPLPTPLPVQSPGAVADPSKSWLWQFSTGPALGGVLALGAAVLAFIRIGHQVKETRNGNNETARKNSEEQWWDTLKWTYTEAKDSTTNSGPFQEVAAVRILESLDHDHDKLTVQQKQAIESIRDIFGQSKKPEVQEAVAPLYQSFGHISPREYEEDFRKVLTALNLGVVDETLGRYYDYRMEFGGKSVLIELKMLRSLAEENNVSRFLLELLGSADRENTVGLLVTNNGVSRSLKKRIDDLSKQVRVDTVQWSPGDSPDLLKEVLTGLLDGA